MFEFHGDRKRYFDIQVENTRQYVLPFIEQKFAIKEGTRVLEIGCGEAGVLKAFTDRGCVGVGVEFDEIRLVYAREWLTHELQKQQISFISKDIYKVNVDEEFELVEQRQRKKTPGGISGIGNNVGRKSRGLALAD